MSSQCKPLAVSPDQPATPPLDPYLEPYHATPPLQGLPNGPTPQGTHSPSSRPGRYRHRDYVVYTQDQLPQFMPYTDNTRDENEDPDDNVPLAYLYPPEAPPSYIAAVTQAYHGTLISHIRSRSESTLSTERALDDQESGLTVSEYSDESRFKLGKAVAMLVVALVLFVLGGVMALFVVGITDLRLRWS